MRHKVFSAAIGIGLAAVLVPASATTAQAADPTGYWRKAEQGKYPAKMQLYYCGGRSICVKIAWLQNPRDSQGRELQDVRNVNPSLRGRTIEGMHIIRGMKQVSANQWKGTVYNPEDGKTYSASVTLASSRQIVLKGCVASFLCREQVWLRTSAPPPREEEPQVEASAKPETAPAAQPAKPPAAAAASAASTGLTMGNVSNADVQAPTAPEGGAAGLSYLNASKPNQHPAGYTGESVSSMFSMATPVVPNAAQTAARPAPALAPAAPAPAARPEPASRQAAIEPEPAQPAPVQSEATAPEASPEQAAEEDAADPTLEDQRMTWRERRQQRRQRRLKELQQQGQNLIPWMRQ
jgi:uncharacterized protein (DUF2147 family)